MNSENNTSDKNSSFDINELGIIPAMSPVSAAFMGLFLVFVLYQFGGGLLTILVAGSNPAEADMNLMRVLTAFGQFAFILIPGLLLTKLVYGEIKEVVRFNKAGVIEAFLYILGMAILIPLTQYYLYLQNFIIAELAKRVEFINSMKLFLDKMDDMLEGTYLKMMAYDTPWEMLLIVFVMTMVPAICEETFFRGFVQRSFEFKIKPIYAAIITSVGFALYHFNPYGFIPLVGLGLYFGYAAYKSNSIIIPMIIHMINNLVSVTVYFKCGEEEFLLPETFETGELISSSVYFVLFTIVFISLIVFINYYHNTYKNNIREVNNDLPQM